MVVLAVAQIMVVAVDLAVVLVATVAVAVAVVIPVAAVVETVHHGVLAAAADHLIQTTVELALAVITMGMVGLLLDLQDHLNLDL